MFYLANLTNNRKLFYNLDTIYFKMSLLIFLFMKNMINYLVHHNNLIILMFYLHFIRSFDLWLEFYFEVFEVFTDIATLTQKILRWPLGLFASRHVSLAQKCERLIDNFLYGITKTNGTRLQYKTDTTFTKRILKRIIIIGFNIQEFTVCKFEV